MSDGGNLTRDIVLRVRAQNLATADFKQLTAQVNELAAGVNNLTEAAGRGEVKERELTQTLAKFGQAVDNLKSIAATIESFKGLELALKKDEDALARATTKLTDFRAANETAVSGVGALGKELKKLENDETRATTALENRQKRQAENISSLEKQGFSVRDLSSAEQQLLTVTNQIAAATQQLTDAQQNYAANVRKNAEALALQKKAAQEAARAENELAAAEKARAAAQHQELAAQQAVDRQQSHAEVTAGADAFNARVVARRKAEEEAAAKTKEREQVQIRANQINHDLELQRIRAELKVRSDAIEKAKQAERDAAQAKRDAADEALAEEGHRREQEYRANRGLEERVAEVRRRSDLGAIGRFREDMREKRRLYDEERGAIRTVAKEEEERTTKRRGGGAAAGGVAAAGTRTGFLGLRPYELTNLGYQATDVVQGALSGVSPGIIAAQQGPQIVQIFGTAILRWSPIIVAGIAAITVAMGALQRTFRDQSSNREFAAALVGSTNSTKYNKEQLTALRKEAIDMGMSWKDAGEAIKTAMSFRIRQDNIKELLQAAQDTADVNGEKVPEAMKKFASALSGGADDILKLNDSYDFLDAKSAQFIRDKFAEGKAEEARAFAAERLSQRLRAQAKEWIDPWTEASRKLKIAWDDLLVTIGNTQAFKDANNWIIKTIGEIGNLAKAIDDVVKDKPGARKSLWDNIFENMFGSDWRAGERSLNAVKRALGLPEVGQSGVVATAKIPLATGPGTSATAADAAAPSRFINPQKLTLDEPALRVLGNMLSQAASQLPPGYTVQAISTSRPGATVRGTGQPSEHSFDRAIDVKIVDPTGKDVPGYMGVGAPIYKELDEAIKKVSAAAGLNIAIGTTFGKPDAGHYSILGREAALNTAKRGDLTTGPTPEQGRIGQDLVIAEEKRLAISRASSIEAEKRAELDKITLDAQKETQDPAAQKRLIDLRYTEVAVKLDREQRDIEDKRNKERIDDARHYNEIRAAGDKAVADAQAKQKLSWREIEQERDKGQAAERDRLARIDAENDRYTQAVKIVDDLARGVNNAYSTDVAKRIEAITLKYKDQEEALKKLRDASPLGDKARFDAKIAELPDLERREKGQAEGAGLLAQAQATAATRKDLVDSYKRLRELGVISITEEENKTKEAFEGTTKATNESLDALEKWLEKAKELGVPAIEIEKTRAKMAELKAEAQHIDPFLKGLRTTIEDSFTNRAAEAFDSASEAIGGAIAKTKEWKDVWVSLRNAAANFFAGVLKDIATYVIKAQLAKAVSSFLPGFGGAASAASAAASGTASAVGAVGSSGMSAGWTSILSGAAAVAHEGGIIGQTQLPRRDVPGSWFDRAPRYHTGAVVGLAANEQAAILQSGEEVLAANSPRHARNWSGGAAPDINIRNVLVADPELVPAHMASARGEKVIMSTLTRNAATVRQLVR